MKGSRMKMSSVFIGFVQLAFAAESVAAQDAPLAEVLGRIEAQPFSATGYIGGGDLLMMKLPEGLFRLETTVSREVLERMEACDLWAEDCEATVRGIVRRDGSDLQLLVEEIDFK